MPDVPLPDVHAGLLGPADLDAYVRDLDACAEMISVLARARARGGAPSVLATPQDAVDRMRAGTLPAVQLRYRFDGGTWLDTLTTTPDGIRLVRIRHDAAAAPENRP